jgi:hypothetical protein
MHSRKAKIANLVGEHLQTKEKTRRGGEGCSGEWGVGSRKGKWKAFRYERHFFLSKLKDNFLLKTFLWLKVQEPNENIFNSH